MANFTLLWQKTLQSSLWIKESKETRLVFLTMLMMKDQHGLISSSLIGLADSAKVTVEECESALRILLAPDINDSSGVEEGRRIRKVPGGWQIVNNDLYRFSTEAKREFWKQQKAEYRQKLAEAKMRKEFIKSQRATQQRGQAREIRHEQAVNDGDYNKAAAIAAEGTGRVITEEQRQAEYMRDMHNLQASPAMNHQPSTKEML